MTESERIGLHSGIWIVLFAIALVVSSRRRKAIGLTATFLLTYMANHWIGSAIYVLPWHHHYPASVVAAGLRQSLWGMAAFAFGALVLCPVFTRGSSVQPSDPPPAEQVQCELPGRIRTYLLIGVSFYSLRILIPFWADIPSLGTLTHVLTRFTVFGAYLFAYAKMRTAPRDAWWYVLLIAGLWPAVGVVFRGFASFASVISILIIMFYLSYNRIDVKKLVFLFCAAYVGLSGYVTYMGHRAELRASVWGQQSLSSRLEVFIDMALEFEFFSVENPDHLYYIDVRLNRNYYVGLAAQSLEAGHVDYARGETFLKAFIAPIPRALWPGKPRVSGDNTMMTRFTGLLFPRSTATGSGPLFEGFVNFGSAGVVVIFALYGLFLGILDAQGRRSLDAGRYFEFALYSLPIIDLLDNVQPTGSFLASMVATLLVFKVLQPHLERLEARRLRVAVDRGTLARPFLAERSPVGESETPVQPGPSGPRRTPSERR